VSFEIVIPQSIWGGFYWRARSYSWAIGLMAHSLQCDQRWIFLLRYQPGRRSYRFGYRTMGDATPKLMTSKDAGWHWPWQDRSVAGRG
jgi:hypothetical protein